MKLIDKDAVVEEIESERKFYLDKEEYDFGWNNALDKILSFLDTIEVKDVDLEKEIESYFKGYGKFPSVGIDDCIDIAKHFFMLGLKAQKGEEL